MAMPFPDVILSDKKLFVILMELKIVRYKNLGLKE